MRYRGRKVPLRVGHNRREEDWFNHMAKEGITRYSSVINGVLVYDGTLATRMIQLGIHNNFLR
ncbi:MAG: hypothetical protein QM762_12650 [Chryseolinea sp.]